MSILLIFLKKKFFGESIGENKSMKGKANTNNKKSKKTIDENNNSKSQINQLNNIKDII